MRLSSALLLSAALCAPAWAAVTVSSFEDASPGDAMDGAGEVVADGPGVTDGEQALRLPLADAPRGTEPTKIGHVVVDNGFLTENAAGFAADGLSVDVDVPDSAEGLSLQVAIFYVNAPEDYRYRVIATEPLDGSGVVGIRFDGPAQEAFQTGAVEKGYAQPEFSVLNPRGASEGAVTLDRVRLLTPDDADPNDEPADADEPATPEEPE